MEPYTDLSLSICSEFNIGLSNLPFFLTLRRAKIIRQHPPIGSLLKIHRQILLIDLKREAAVDSRVGISRQLFALGELPECLFEHFIYSVLREIFLDELGRQATGTCTELNSPYLVRSL